MAFQESKQDDFLSQLAEIGKQQIETQETFKPKEEPTRKENLREGLKFAMQPEFMANFLLPILGIVETAASEGRSPGTGAMQHAGYIQRGQALKEARETREEAKKVREAKEKREALERLQEKNIKLKQEQGEKLIAALDPNSPTYQREYANIMRKYFPTEHRQMTTKQMLQRKKDEDKGYTPKTEEEWKDIEKRKRMELELRKEYGITDPYAALPAIMDKLMKTEDVKAQAKRKAELMKQRVNFERVKSLMRNTWARKMAQIDEGKKLGFEEGGLPVGWAGKGGAFLRKKGFEAAASFDGQRIETAMALNSILTGQNRVIESVLQMILSTLPDVYDNESFARAKIEQSIRNSYGLVKAMERAGMMEEAATYTDEELKDKNSEFNQRARQLTPEQLDEMEEEEIQGIMKYVFGGVKTKTSDRIEKLKQLAKDGDVDAQNYLNKKGIPYQEEAIRRREGGGFLGMEEML